MGHDGATEKEKPGRAGLVSRGGESSAAAPHHVEELDVGLGGLHDLSTISIASISSMLYMNWRRMRVFCRISGAAAVPRGGCRSD
jgi:hypothetical protein